MTAYICITLSIIVSIVIFLWTIKQRGGTHYFLAVSYTCALLPIVCFCLFGEPSSVDTFIKGTVLYSFFTFPIALFFTIVFFCIAYKLGATNIPVETRVFKPIPLKWFCYVLLNGVVINSVLYITFESKEILCYITSTAPIILQYPILCKMENWTKKSLILTATMLIFLFLFYFIHIKYDTDKTVLSNIGSAMGITLMGFCSGSFYLMFIIWMNYALRKRLF